MNEDLDRAHRDLDDQYYKEMSVKSERSDIKFRDQPSKELEQLYSEYNSILKKSATILGQSSAKKNKI